MKVRFRPTATLLLLFATLALQSMLNAKDASSTSTPTSSSNPSATAKEHSVYEYFSSGRITLGPYRKCPA
jgi:hypothetical protein